MNPLYNNVRIGSKRHVLLRFLESEREARLLFREFAEDRIPEDVSCELELCVGETFSNAVKYGFGAVVSMTLWLRSSEILVQICYRTLPFPIDVVEPPLLEERGRGIYIMQKFGNAKFVFSDDSVQITFRRNL